MPSGFRTFAALEVLTASNVQNYLMEQTVSVFASTAARDSAISSPEAGQHAFTTDTDTLWYYSGSAWVAAGGASWAPLVSIETDTGTPALTSSYQDVGAAFSATLPTGWASMDVVARAQVDLSQDASGNVALLQAQLLVDADGGGTDTTVVDSITITNDRAALTEQTLRPWCVVKGATGTVTLQPQAKNPTSTGGDGAGYSCEVVRYRVT